MSQTDQGLSAQIIAEIKKEAFSQVGKWTVGAFVFLFGIAASGWWFYLKQKVDEYIVVKAGGIPESAIVAFDLPHGCPKGWKMFEPGISRVIIGATQGQQTSPNHDQNVKTLSSRPYRQEAGEEAHILTVEELPPHDHGIQIIQHSEYVREKGYLGTESIGRDALRSDPKWAIRYTESVGGGRPHNVMPPFVALYYCIKDAS